MSIISALYKISELCKDKDITVEMHDGYIIIKWFDFFSYEKPMEYKQAFDLNKIENDYKTLENVIDEFLTRRDKELDRFKMGAGQSATSLI